MKAGDEVMVVLDAELKREMLQQGVSPFHDDKDVRARVVRVHADDQHVDASISDCPAVRATGLAPYSTDALVRSYYVGSERPELSRG